MAKKIVYPEKKDWYRSWRRKKRSGGFRIIEAPNEELKKVQRQLYVKLLKKYKPSDICNCGVKGRNTTRAATQIIGKRYKWKTDIHDFFGSITGDMVLEGLLSNKTMSRKVAEKIRYLCTNKYDVLPQGAPTSPFLANVSCTKMLNYMAKAIKQVNSDIAVYADDIIVSSDSLENLRKAKYLVVKLLNKFGLSVNKDKSKYLRKKQEVLGICVEPGLNHTRLPRKNRYNLRAWLHNVAKKLEAGEKLDSHTLCELSGHVAYANMVGDQYAPKFNAKLMYIRGLLERK